MNKKSRPRLATNIGKMRHFCFSVLIGAATLASALPFASHAQVAAESAVLSSNAPSKAGAAKPASGSVSFKRSLSAASKGYAPVCLGEFAPAVNVSLPHGKSGTLDLKKLNISSPAWLRSIGNPEVVRVEPLASAAPRNMYFLFGKMIGSTNLMFQNQQGQCAMVEVSVGVDTASVQASLMQLMPEERSITVGSAADSLVLSGTVSDAEAAERAVSIASAYVRGRSGSSPGGVTGANSVAGSAGNHRILNLLGIGAPQQVMLEVKIAEVSKSLLDKIGIDTRLHKNSGSWAYSLLSDFSAGGKGVLGAIKSNGNQFLLDAEKTDGLVKILAEPTVMAISGQEGSFLAGGKIYIPVAQELNKVTLEEKEFGVGLKFTPTVLSGGRINIKVAPEVSELSKEGIGITTSSTGVLGSTTNILPLITTRRAATTVQLMDGQSFAIGGLIRNNTSTNLDAMPVLGELPILGALFRSASFQQDKTELLFVITPRLVKPLNPDYSLPTDAVANPSRAELFLGGRLEGVKPEMAAMPMANPRPAQDGGRAAGPSGFELK